MKDFHSADAANKAGEDWAKQFQKNETPDGVDELSIPKSAVIAELKDPDASLSNGGCAVRVDKLMKEAGLASSRTEAERKIKEGAVTINGNVVTSPIVNVSVSGGILVRVGKRVKRIHLT